MENILIILVLVGSFVYKIYSSYKEEMEKAAQRQKKQSRPSKHSIPPPFIETTRKTSSIPVPPVHKPKETTVLQKAHEKKPIIQHKSESNKQDTPIEVKHAQFLREEKLRKKSAVNENHESRHSNFDFDLRQAVIQSAILERPYK